MDKYTKSIVVAIGTIIAVGVAVYRGEAVDTIPGSTEMVIGLITTFLAYALPNKEL